MWLSFAGRDHYPSVPIVPLPLHRKAPPAPGSGEVATTLSASRSAPQLIHHRPPPNRLVTAAAQRKREQKAWRTRFEKHYGSEAEVEKATHAATRAIRGQRYDAQQQQLREVQHREEQQQRQERLELRQEQLKQQQREMKQRQKQEREKQHERREVQQSKRRLQVL